MKVEQSSRYRSPAVDRAFRALQALADNPLGLTLSELSRTIGIAPSTLVGILGSLREHHGVRLIDGRRYTLDVGVHMLSTPTLLGADLAAHYYSIGAELADNLRGMSQIGLLAGPDVIYIARHVAHVGRGYLFRPERQLPAHGSAIGKMLLSYLDAAELRRVLGEEPLHSMTPDTITDYARLEAELATIRRVGMAESNGECIAGLYCVAAPVIRDGQPVAAVSASLPSSRLTRRARAAAINRTSAAVSELTHRLASDRTPLRASNLA